MIVGQLIRAYRLKNKIRLRTLALDIDIPHATLSRLENGEGKVDGETMRKLINWLFM
jgi:transcriptional regulator with XRE-family HTH domain